MTEYYNEIHTGYLQTVMSLSNSIEAKDAYTRGHCQRVMEISCEIATRMGFGEDDIEDLRYAAILHDIGKLEELGESAPDVFDYTLTGSMLGHIFIGASWFNKTVPDDFPADLRLRITHIILSHHGKLEYGSPVLPQTYEAIIVNRLDDSSSLLNAVANQYKTYNGTSEFSERMHKIENQSLYLRPYTTE